MSGIPSRRVASISPTLEWKREQEEVWVGFAMFNVPADEQRKSAEDMNRWAVSGQLKPVIGRNFPLAEAAEAERFLDANSSHGAGTLTGKVIISIV